MFDFTEYVLGGLLQVALKPIFQGHGMDHDFASLPAPQASFGSRSSDEGHSIQKSMQTVVRTAHGSFREDDQRMPGHGL